MKRRCLADNVIFGIDLLLATTAAAIPTTLTVRARAHDAKFIGSGVGVITLATDDKNNQVVDTTSYAVTP